jgi:aryl-alcohol dehydrogenase-like predicted oxidoreductase
MNLSHGYGVPLSDTECEKVVHRALDCGVDLFDTAMLYGSGLNETVLGKILTGSLRDRIILCTKGGMADDTTDPAKPRRLIDSRPHVIQANCEASLKRLNTDVIDLYYLHRWDKKTPLEDVIGAMADLIRQGKVKAIGLSEVSAATLEAANKIFPISALQSEYSLWTRNPEIATLEKCKALNTAFVAFSPLGRGALSGQFCSAEDLAALHSSDMRHTMPRFMGENFKMNQRLFRAIEEVAQKAGCSRAQLALAWVLSRGEHVISIPGSRSADHVTENMRTLTLQISPEHLEEVGQRVNQQHVQGTRYDAAGEAAVDTEMFP